MFQCLQTTLVIFSIDWLYVNTSRILVSFEVVLILKVLSWTFKKKKKKFFSTRFFICLFICSCLKAWLANCCLSSSHYWLKPFGIVQINLIASIWLYWKLSFSDVGCSEHVLKIPNMFHAEDIQKGPCPMNFLTGGMGRVTLLAKKLLILHHLEKPLTKFRSPHHRLIARTK